MQIAIREDGGRRVVIGEYDPDHLVFSKKIKGSKHILRKLDAIGIDAATFKNLIEAQCNVVMVEDTETGTKYMTTPDIIAKRGEYKHYKPHRAQIFLSRRYWARSGDILSAERIKQVLQDAHVGV